VKEARKVAFASLYGEQWHPLLPLLPNYKKPHRNSGKNLEAWSKFRNSAEVGMYFEHSSYTSRNSQSHNYNFISIAAQVS
jgi:hypothetical protein